ncbi:MAG: molybdate ABC transporter substrate-binding protein, partial [Limibaculum sp.]
MRALFRRLTLLLALTSGLSTGAMAVGGEALTVFAAASLTEAMTASGRKFEQSQGIAVRFSFAASSTLARQIEAGAPAGLIALASEEWADYLAKRGAILPETRISAVGNRLVLIAP